ncbi:MAG: hydroxyacid dehydrogenase [Clostridiales bacterium]|nr:hydroxyacid dehydrogenase [Clostridiales bacterium]
MEKCVYSVLDEGTVMKEILEEAGFRVIIGNGKMEDELLAQCSALVPGKCYVNQEVLDKAPGLKMVSKFGVGVDKIDIPACTARGVYVTNTARSNFISVAEHTIALMLAAAKKLYPISRVFHVEEPDWYAAKQVEGIELHGKTLSVIGLGNIGRRVAAIAQAFDMKIAGYDPYANPDTLPENIQLFDNLKDALGAGDFVTIHVAGGESVRHMINAETLAAMKPTAILINTTRGFVIDERALAEALEKHVIAGAALDVFETEPVTGKNPLLTMENVIATPHNAANTPDARLRSQKACAENIISLFAGIIPESALNHPRKR